MESKSRCCIKFLINQTTIKFRIKEKEIRDRVLRRGMWNIAEVPMVVSKWSLIIEEVQRDIKSIPMWISIKHVPHKMFSWKRIGFLASAVGEPKRLHPDTVLCKSFEKAKVFVEADLSKTLPKSFRFQSEKGVDAVVEFIYPWLPSKCTSCSKWGHLKDDCMQSTRNRAATPEAHAKEQVFEDAANETLQKNTTNDNLEQVALSQSEVTEKLVPDAEKGKSGKVKQNNQEIAMNAETEEEKMVTPKIVGKHSDHFSKDIQEETIDLTKNQTEVKQKIPTTTQSSETWTEVSPNKGCLLGEMKTARDELNQSSHISITPSRFTVLQDEVEDGEISEDSQGKKESS